MIAKIFVEIAKLIRDIIKVLCLFVVLGVLIGIVFGIDPKRAFSIKSKI